MRAQECRSSTNEIAGYLGQVCSVVRHPEWNTEKGDNDVAILHLCRPLQYTQSILHFMEQKQKITVSVSLCALMDNRIMP